MAIQRLYKQVKEAKETTFIERAKVWQLDRNPKYGNRAGITPRERYLRAMKYHLRPKPYFTKKERLQLEGKQPIISI